VGYYTLGRIVRTPEAQVKSVGKTPAARMIFHKPELAGHSGRFIPDEGTVGRKAEIKVRLRDGRVFHSTFGKALDWANRKR
jgi:hypothetical protein